MLAGDGGSSADRAGGLTRAVDCNRIAGVFRIKANVGMNPKTVCDAPGKMADALFQLFSH